ncbi:hypothetical protein K1X13_05210 [Nocardioides sp. WL0053]|uniref:Uncharacterized protein n=1 Tax=Nocardioides jiangsuensis TaxID=2866161 RepID=A0ABS7RI81_9ACTN|nr:hypothetical protein [Nocardioides jiangsuensis]MBY9074217.1 hypothetical protein [Nocardioides jiangsuensis]
MKQTIKTVGPGIGRTSHRYEQLLEERIKIGRIYVDALCHRAAMADAERLFRNVERLDGQLDRFRRYSQDQFRQVMPAEDDRWHVPGQPPAGPECHLCAKQDLGLLLQMVLPAAAGRVA